MNLRGIICIIFLTIPLLARSQRVVSFYTADSVEVFGDLYVQHPSNPYIILTHQYNSSRGEYKEIASKLMNLNYNCLAIDLRFGSEANFVKNKTVENLKIPSPVLFHSIKDIDAAVNYVFNKNSQEVILFGSGFSASLCMLVAKNNPKVDAVVACEPGEFFLPEVEVGKAIHPFDKRICLVVDDKSLAHTQSMVYHVAGSLKTFISHKAENGIHGAEYFWKENETSESYWFDLLLFFNSIRR